MRFTVSEQMWCLFCSFLCGLLVGAVYDVLRVIRNLIFTGKVSVFVCDFLFVAFFSFASVFFSMAFSRGATRYFSLIGDLCGFFAFRFTFGRISLPLWRFLITKIRLILKKAQIKSQKTMKKVLQPIYKILYNTNRKRMFFAKRHKS
ncbi:MAG: spore cortex biosynthesis protein YabQ [Ruminococcus sp.]|nr:spore cortex biosynthesis protein YabQ [Ruminococcus sp.]